MKMFQKSGFLSEKNVFILFSSKVPSFGNNCILFFCYSWTFWNSNSRSPLNVSIVAICSAGDYCSELPQCLAAVDAGGISLLNNIKDGATAAVDRTSKHAEITLMRPSPGHRDWPRNDHWPLTSDARVGISVRRIFQPVSERNNLLRRIDSNAMNTLYTTLYFSNNSVKKHPISMIFGTQHSQETWYQKVIIIIIVEIVHEVHINKNLKNIKI